MPKTKATAAWATLLICQALLCRKESHKGDQFLIVIDAEQRCEIIAETLPTVSQFSERHRTTSFDDRISIEVGDHASFNERQE